MYMTYPHDVERQQFDFAERALESDTVNSILKSGSAVVACTANVQATLSVIFPKPFTPNTVPDVMVCLTSIGNATSIIKYLIGASALATGFTIQLLTDTTQSVTVTWYAKGITT